MKATLAADSDQLYGVGEAPAATQDVYAQQVAWFDLLRRHSFAELDQRALRAHHDYLEHRIDGEHYWALFSLFRALGSVYEPDFDEWVASMPQSSIALLARSIYLTNLAYLRRAGNFKNQTSKEQLAAMRECLERAERDADEAAKRLPACPLCLHAHLFSESALSRGDAYREQASRELHRFPDLWRLVSWIDRNLEPRWGGSFAGMAQFTHWLSIQFPGSEVVRYSEALMLNEMAQAAEWQRDEPAAIRYMALSIARYPTVDALMRRIVANLKLRDYPAVDRDITDAQSDHALNLVLFNTIGLADVRRGRRTEAQAEFERVLLFDPDDNYARRNLIKLRSPPSPLIRPVSFIN